MYEDKIWISVELMRSDRRYKERKGKRVLGGGPTLSALGSQKVIIKPIRE